MDRKREVAVAPVSDVDRIEGFGQVLGWPVDIDAGRRLVFRG